MEPLRHAPRKLAHDLLIEQIVKPAMENVCTEKEAEIMGEHFFQMIMPKSDFEKAIMTQIQYGMYGYHPLCEPDRLANPELKFPICFAYGDKDFLGTKGAEIICNANIFRETGES